MNDNQNSRIYGIIVTIMLAIAAGFGFFFWEKSKMYLEQSEQGEKEKTALLAEKHQIEASLDSLSNAYSSLRTENENLQGKVSSSAALVAQKEIVINQIKSANAKDLQTLRDQVASLQKTKIELETIISTLQTENAQLKDENARLTTENTDLKGQNTQLNDKMEGMAKQLEEQIRKTQSANFRATSFRVEMERRGDKLTTRAKKVREIFVSFDLADVPEPFQGPQKLYLVISNDKGNPIPSTNPTKATIAAPTGPVEIQAQLVKQVVLETTQRQSFSYKLDERLVAGSYVAAIYCDKGLLGASTFRLQ